MSLKENPAADEAGCADSNANCNSWAAKGECAHLHPLVILLYSECAAALLLWLCQSCTPGMRVGKAVE